MNARTMRRPSPSGVGTDPNPPAGSHGLAGAADSPARVGVPPAGDREQQLASAYGRGLAYHRWHRDGDALRLAGQMLLFAIEPQDFVQDPEAEPWPS